MSRPTDEERAEDREYRNLELLSRIAEALERVADAMENAYHPSLKTNDPR